MSRRTFAVGVAAAGAGMVLPVFASGGASKAEAKARAIARPHASLRDKARAVYAFVHTEIAFGFTARFDAASPDQTLSAGRGHCNPQASLCVTMMRAVGIEARLRAFEIDNAILDGLFSVPLPARLTHTITEVRLDGVWLGLDGYIIDPALMTTAQARLRREGRVMGYGVHVDGQGAWDGHSVIRSQLVHADMVRGDYGSVASMRALQEHPRYHHRAGVLGRVARAAVLPGVNRTLASIRNEGA